MSIARVILSASLISGLMTGSNAASAANCATVLLPHNRAGTTPVSIALTTRDARFTGWMGGTLQSDGTYLTASLHQLFSDRMGDLVCDGMFCSLTQPFDHQQPGDFTVYIRMSDALLWLWNGSQWEGPFSPINNCDTGMLYYAGTDYGYMGMFQIGLGDTIAQPIIK